MKYLYEGDRLEDLFFAVNRALSRGISPWYGADADGLLLLFTGETDARNWIKNQVQAIERSEETLRSFGFAKQVVEYLGGERIEVRWTSSILMNVQPTSKVFRIWPYVPRVR
jgi:hypothetical protein